MKLIQSYLATHSSFHRCCKEITAAFQDAFMKEPPDGILLFMPATTASEDILTLFKAAFPTTTIFGCSCSAVFTEKGSSTHGIAALAYKTAPYYIHPRLFTHEGKANVLRNMISQQTYSLTQDAKSEKHLFLFLSTLETSDHSFIINGFEDYLGKRFPIIGAIASDHFEYKHTFCFLNTTLLPHASIGLLFSGDVSFGCGIHNGWQPIGVPKPLTRSQGNCIKTIQNEPAFEFYATYFGEYAYALKSPSSRLLSTLYPIGLKSETAKDIIIRNVLSIKPDGSIICQNEIPKAANVRLMVTSKQQTLNALKKAALEARRSYPGEKPDFLITFCPAARHTILRSSISEDTNILNELFGSDVPKIGFYGFGQYAPMKQNWETTHASLQDQSVVVLAIGKT